MTTKSASKLAAGVAVSFSGAGQVQKGGGTSIYRNVGSIPSDLCPKYLSAIPIFDDKYLVSFRVAATGTGAVSVMAIDISGKLSTVLSSANTVQSLYGIVTLNQASGLFVSITQDNSFISPNTAVIAGQSDLNNNYAIRFGNAYAYMFPGQFSLDPSIAALSSTTFAIAFYGGTYATAYPLSAYTRFGEDFTRTVL